MKRMFTDFAGKDRFDEGHTFWAWDYDELEDNDWIIEVEIDGYEVDDVGLYNIIDLSKVTWIETI